MSHVPTLQVEPCTPPRPGPQVREGMWREARARSLPPCNTQRVRRTALDYFKTVQPPLLTSKSNLELKTG